MKPAHIPLPPAGTTVDVAAHLATAATAESTTKPSATPAPAPVVIPEAVYNKLYATAHPSYHNKLDKPILLSINRKILDVSFGGQEMYGPGGGYHIFAGIDCSKALAKMKFDEELWNDTDLSELSEEERKVLDEWDKKLCSKYPQVGVLVD